MSVSKYLNDNINSSNLTVTSSINVPNSSLAYSKLNLSNSIVNGDINSSAAIAYSKMNLSNSIQNTDINSGASIGYSKLNLANSIVNADISTSAAILPSKLSGYPSNATLFLNGNGG